MSLKYNSRRTFILGTLFCLLFQVTGLGNAPFFSDFSEDFRQTSFSSWEGDLNGVQAVLIDGEEESELDYDDFSFHSPSGSHKVDFIEFNFTVPYHLRQFKSRTGIKKYVLFLSWKIDC